MSSLAHAVAHGIDNNFIEWAENFGKGISTDVTSSQIRNVYGTVKIMEMQSFELARLLLLKPRIAYANARHKGLQELADQLTSAIDEVDKGKGKQEQEERFKRFAQGFEAILAYHKVGGSTKGSQQHGGRRK